MTDAPAERRRQPRRRVVKEGRIVFGDFRFSFDCSIRNVTPSGAQVQVAPKAEVPETFYLYQAANRTLSEAKVMWRKGSAIGVQFTGEKIEVNGNSDPRLARFRYA